MTKAFGPLALTVSVMLLGSSGVTLAGPVGQTGSFSWTRQNGFYQGTGGEFSIEMTSGSLTNASYFDAGTPGDTNAAADLLSSKNIGAGNTTNFQTFCLELSENATTPSYFVVGNAAYRGSTSTNDPISVGTAWLYSQFAQGNLTVTTPLAGNYFSTGGPTRPLEARTLQIAIWALEQENLSSAQTTDLLTNPYYHAALNNFGNLTNARATATGEQLADYGVYVLINFTTAAARDQFKQNPLNYDPAYRSQDFLYYQRVSVPDGSATLMLLGGALAIIGALRRRMKN
jgi:hypothetical protein